MNRHETKKRPSADGKYHGGRPKGSPNRRTSRTIDEIRTTYDILPLDHMLNILNDEQEPAERRDRMAMAAAPYVHSRLTATEITGAERGPVKYSVDLKKLSNEQLVQLERIMTVCSVPQPANDDDAIDQAGTA
jgi:hypothetical protein